MSSPNKRVVPNPYRLPRRKKQKKNRGNYKYKFKPPTAPTLHPIFATKPRPPPPIQSTISNLLPSLQKDLSLPHQLFKQRSMTYYNISNNENLSEFEQNTLIAQVASVVKYPAHSKWNKNGEEYPEMLQAQRFINKNKNDPKFKKLRRYQWMKQIIQSGRSEDAIRIKMHELCGSESKVKEPLHSEFVEANNKYAKVSCPTASDNHHDVLHTLSQNNQNKYQSRQQKRQKKIEREQKLQDCITGIAAEFLKDKDKENKVESNSKNIRNELKNTIDTLERDAANGMGELDKLDFKILKKSVYKYTDILTEDYERLKSNGMNQTEIVLELLEICSLLSNE